jgi:cell wall-associated NlpC family hydrolase
MNKRFISISTVVLVMTGSGAAFGQILESNATTTEQSAITQVTTPDLVISYPVTKTVDAFSGPVKISELSTGPIIREITPKMGSLEWMAQEKAEKDKLKTDAELKQEELEAEISRLEKVAKDTKNLNKAIAATKRYIGKTWYALGGSTPDAWDCSGLVLWTYGHLGIDLYHSASVQKESGEYVTDPKIGDIVAFTYRGSTRAFHTGIVVGPDDMLHSGGKRGDKTEITSISRWSKSNGNSTVTYTRIVETNN